MHSTGSMYSMSSVANFSESFFGWMQSTGHASTHAASFTPIQGSAITYAIEKFSTVAWTDLAGAETLFNHSGRCVTMLRRDVACWHSWRRSERCFRDVVG